jgi:hypothetical protein
MPNIASGRDAIQDQLANKYSATPENIHTGFDSSLSPSTIKVIRPNVRSNSSTDPLNSPIINTAIIKDVEIIGDPSLMDTLPSRFSWFDWFFNRFRSIKHPNRQVIIR